MISIEIQCTTSSVHVFSLYAHDGYFIPEKYYRTPIHSRMLFSQFICSLSVRLRYKVVMRYPVKNTTEHTRAKYKAVSVRDKNMATTGEYRMEQKTYII